MNIKYSDKTICKTAIILIAAVLVFSNYAHAAISVTPDRHIVSILPGEETVVMYHIQNVGEEDISIVIEPKAWSGLRSPYQWLFLEDDNIYVKAGESTPFIVNIKAPNNATGEMVAMLFLCYKDSSQSQLNIRNGVPLYMSIKGTEDYSLEIKDIDLSYTKKGHFYYLNFTVNIKNTGNIHIVPDVSVMIKYDDRILNTLYLKGPNIVLRDKEHTYRLGWREPGLRDGTYRAEVVLDYEDKIGPKAKEIKFQVTGGMIEKLETEKAGD
jgi:uncharacterized membrane protein